MSAPLDPIDEVLRSAREKARFDAARAKHAGLTQT